MPSAPQITQVSREELERLIAPFHIHREAYPLLLVGIRGFQAARGKNRRNVYDDAICILTDRVCATFRANTDPSKHGINPRLERGYAVLCAGSYPAYRFDIHNGAKPHEAICQRAATVNFTRDGSAKIESGIIGINIHRGGEFGTSSEGCQTVPPQEWRRFYDLAKQEAVRLWGEKWRSNIVSYTLIEA